MIGRIGIDDIEPVISAGQFAAKAVVGEYFPVSASVWREGHDAVAATLHVESPVRGDAVESPMYPAHEPDTYNGAFIPNSPGYWSFRIDAWSDPYTTWNSAVTKKLDAGQGAEELANDLETGARLLERAVANVPAEERRLLTDAIESLRAEHELAVRVRPALAPEVVALLTEHPVRELVTRSRSFRVWVDRTRALYGSWYEMFPRSTGGWDN